MMIQNKIYSYFERNENLRVLFLFDPVDEIGAELYDLVWKPGYRYVDFDGCWFRTQYRLEHEWANDKVILRFLRQSPATTKDKQDFPLLGLLVANMEYKNDDYAAFMQHNHIDMRFSQYVQRHIAELQLEKVNKIIGAYYNQSFDINVVNRGMISVYLEASKLLDWDEILVRLLILGLPEEKNKRDSFFRKLIGNKDAQHALDHAVEDYFGVEISYNEEERVKRLVECLKYNAIAQSLAVIPTDRYKGYKITNAYRLQLMNRVLECGLQHVRLSDKFLKSLTLLGKDIQESEIIKYYGAKANYFYLPDALCWPILQQLLLRINTDAESIFSYVREMSIRINRESEVLKVVHYAEKAASYYKSVKGLGSLVLNSPDLYIRKYVTEFYLVDNCYRKSLAVFNGINLADCPISDELNVFKKQLDEDYAQLTFAFNLEWMRCVEQTDGGFQSVSLKRQADFYQHEVQDYSYKLVVIVSDALRYEVAADLLEELNKDTRNVARLDANLATLPTETKYGKTVLLPHRQANFNKGKMTLDKGYAVDTLSQRSAFLERYRDNACCVDYQTVVKGSQSLNRELFKKPLVYVFHNVIDDIGHSANPTDVVEACRKAVEQLAAMVKSIHASFNVNRVLVTSDHGFLYNDILFEEKDKQRIEEENIEATSRYYLTESNESVPGIIKYPLSGVSEMKEDAVYIALPLATNRLKVPGGGYSFAHGGASLQEMIIPVITSSLKKTSLKQKVNPVLMTKNLSIVSSRLKFVLIQDEAISGEFIEREIVCGLYENEELMCLEKSIGLNCPDIDLTNRQIPVELTLNKSARGQILKLRIYDAEDLLNPLIEENVRNNTLIEQEF
ncbi:PglZ domain-containing protein [Parabacteroides sp. AF17-28]|uniref:PglZ domain-containing protein n=1 Tax=Parabacteroides sp. AF17-28 TaxID=2292241 RepID=UPI001F159C9B|nr:PglZ domain-containing protein [Parabacteroides sp. AF17-28]